ncbi:ferritin-like domain-containing protein [Gemmatimonas sp.]|uniref:ferritin-like domain-containing protein n=1 Tax=Gemmatimonas sp. TaxID=1962908 RepID=UPI003564A414
MSHTEHRVLPADFAASGPQPVAGTNPQNTRRDFLRAAGLTGAALALAACTNDVMLFAPAGPSRAVIGANGSITLDFSTDVDVLNYAYALEQLEAAFYVNVVANAAFASIFAANEQRVLRDVRDHEVVHRDFLATALAGARIPNLTPDFTSVNFANRLSVLNTAKTFEDLGVSAYNGAARYLTNTDYLVVAGKIVSVEARHVAAIRDLLNNRSADFAPSAFDDANTPNTVLAAADPFIVESITAINT